jgi:hypothetical protein
LIGRLGDLPPAVGVSGFVKRRSTSFTSTVVRLMFFRSTAGPEGVGGAAVCARTGGADSSRQTSRR